MRAAKSGVSAWLCGAEAGGAVGRATALTLIRAVGRLPSPIPWVAEGLTAGARAASLAVGAAGVVQPGEHGDVLGEHAPVGKDEGRHLALLARRLQSVAHRPASRAAVHPDDLVGHVVVVEQRVGRLRAGEGKREQRVGHAHLLPPRYEGGRMSEMTVNRRFLPAPREVVLLLPPGGQLIGVIGFVEALDVVNRVRAERGQGPAYRVRYAGVGEGITSIAGLPVGTEPAAEIDALHTLVVGGGLPLAHGTPEDVVAAVLALGSRAHRIVGVCAGAFLLETQKTEALGKN